MRGNNTNDSGRPDGQRIKSSTRRRFLTATGLTGAAALAGCMGGRDVGSSGGDEGGTGTVVGTTESSGKRVVNILTWEGYNTKSIVDEFESEHNATVNAKLISSDSEGFNILKSGGTSKFDLITLNNSWAQRHAQAGTIEPLNPDDYPETDNFLERFQSPFGPFQWKGEMYALPTRWGWDTMTVNSEKVPEEHYSSYDVLWTGGPNGEYKNKIGVMDWPTWNIPKIAQTLGYPPFDQSDEQLEDIKAKLIETFSNMKAVYTGTSALRQALLQEDIVMAPVGNFAMSQLRAEGNDWVNVVIPKEGGMGWTEGICIVKNPNNRELAVAYQNKLISKKGQFNVAWEPSAKSPPVNTNSFDLFSKEQQQALMFSDQGFEAASSISSKVTPYEFSPITDKWTDLWTEAKARAGI